MRKKPAVTRTLGVLPAHVSKLVQQTVKRNVIERVSSWLKEKRQFCTRNHKLASSFKAMVTLACIQRCLRADVSGNP